MQAGVEPGIEYRGAMYKSRSSELYQVVATYIIVICFTNPNLKKYISINASDQTFPIGLLENKKHGKQ
jgi:hypothetical protein